MNKNAGRGNPLIITLRLGSGEELPFLVDTGSGGTCFDTSWTPHLGKPVGTMSVTRWGVIQKQNTYAEPRLYAGNTRLLTGEHVITLDLKGPSSRSGHPIMGILSLDCLRHYCVQLDFAAGKMRFLDDEHSNKENWGKPFPLVDHGDGRFDVRESLDGAKGSTSLVDSGFDLDGWLMPKFYQQWTNQAAPTATGEVHSPNGVLAGETYPDIHLRVIDVESDGIGLRFLSRHLVTLDFPKQTMYLKRTSTGPLSAGD
jgi:hypothetical protein